MDKYTLRQYQSCARMINRLQAEKDELMKRYMSPVKPPSEGGKAGYSDKYAMMAAELDELEQKIDERIDELIDLRKSIEGVMGKLPPSEQEVLTMRYILGMPWEAIAYQLDCSYRHITRRHGKILQKIKDF